MGLDRLRTLVLDAAYRPLHAVRWQRAMVLDLLDRVDVLEYYDALVRSSHDVFPLPAVIRLRKHVRKRRRRIALTRKNLLARDQLTCQYCGVQPAQRELTIDHVMPSSRGGKSTWENLLTACGPCNRRKGNRTPEEAGIRMLSKPRRPTVIAFGREGLFRLSDTPPEWGLYIP